MTFRFGPRRITAQELNNLILAWQEPGKVSIPYPVSPEIADVIDRLDPENRLIWGVPGGPKKDPDSPLKVK